MQSRQASGAYFDGILRDMELITVWDIEQLFIYDAFYCIIVE